MISLNIHVINSGTMFPAIIAVLFAVLLLSGPIHNLLLEWLLQNNRLLPPGVCIQNTGMTWIMIIISSNNDSCN